MFGVPLVALVLGLRSPLDCHRLPAGPEFKLGHYPIRQKGLASLMPDKGWQRHFDEPIPLPKGKKLVTLRDAAEYITKLPKAEHDAEVPMQFVCASMKLRQIFYTQIELRTFHTVWVKNGSRRSQS